jgi:hypothetical protein
LLEISLSISGFIVHLPMLGNCFAIILKLVSRSCLVMYVWRHLTRPLSGLLLGPGHLSFWKNNGVVCANSYDLVANLYCFLAPFLQVYLLCSFPFMCCGRLCVFFQHFNHRC